MLQHVTIYDLCSRIAREKSLLSSVVVVIGVVVVPAAAACAF